MYYIVSLTDEPEESGSAEESGSGETEPAPESKTIRSIVCLFGFPCFITAVVFMSYFDVLCYVCYQLSKSVIYFVVSAMSAWLFLCDFSDLVGQFCLFFVCLFARLFRLSTYVPVIQQFSIECRKTKPKPITFQ